jgi:two-component system nitrate/nitrite response regulator NarL
MSLDLTMLGVSIVCSPLPHVASSPLIPMGVGNPSDELQARAGVAEAAHRLSSREVAILECLVHGDCNKLIARKFQIAESTVKVHIKAILRKLRAANRTQAAIWAMTHLSRNDSNGALSAAE